MTARRELRALHVNVRNQKLLGTSLNPHRKQQRVQRGTAQHDDPKVQGVGPYPGTTPCKLPHLTLLHLP